MTKDKKQDDSFLAETQQEGRASGKVKISDLDKAIAGVNVILEDEVVESIRNTKEEELPTAKIAVYCHDCRELVSAGFGKTLRGNARTVCGVCNSKKISMGREEALTRFYHLNDRPKEEPKKAPPTKATPAKEKSKKK